MTDSEWIQTIGEGWYRELKDTIHSPYFKKLGKDIAIIRKTKEVYPSREDLFRAFRLTPYNHLLRGVLLGQDPYPSNVACGVSFGVKYGTEKIPASLKRIKEEVISDIYPDDPYKYFDYTLQKWANQGILLLNTALTVESGNPGSHISLWKEFTEKVFEILNKKNDLIYLCMGKFAEGVVNTHITNLSCAKIIVGHPSPLNSIVPFLDSKPFSKVNAELEARNLQPIMW